MNTEKVCPLNQFNPCIGDNCAFYLKIESVEIGNKKYNVDLVTKFLSFPCAVSVSWLKAIFYFVASGLKP